MRCCFIETRDRIILQKIISYCGRIRDNIERNQRGFAVFEQDYMFQDACCMCVIQIGELVAQLSDEIKKENEAILWRIIKDTRNFYVHAYGSIDVLAVWSTLLQDIPALEAACRRILSCTAE